MNTRVRGGRGEDQAVEFLREKGYIILERNVVSESGEIDIIARDRDCVVFIEVKVLRYYAAEDLARSVGRRKRSRLLECARRFVAARAELANVRLRFDVIGIMGDKGRFLHLEGAFEEGQAS